MSSSRSEPHVLQCRCQSTPTQPIKNRGGRGGRGTRLLLASSHLIIDHVPLSRRSTVPTPTIETSPAFGRSLRCFFISHRNVCSSLLFPLLVPFACGHHLSPRIGIVFSLAIWCTTLLPATFVYFPHSPTLLPATFLLVHFTSSQCVSPTPPLLTHLGTSVHLLPPPPGYWYTVVLPATGRSRSPTRKPQFQRFRRVQ